MRQSGLSHEPHWETLTERGVKPGVWLLPDRVADRALLNLVSAASSAVLVLFVSALIGAGVLVGEPSISALAASLRNLSLGDAGWFAAATLIVGLVLHPLQFAFVQMLEGYWGPSRLAIRAADAFAQSHMRRHSRLTALADEAGLRLGEAEELGRWLDDHPIATLHHDVGGLHRQRRRLEYFQEEARRVLDKYPPDIDRVMPTSLGNRLRRAEDTAGAAWGIDTVTAAPYLTLVAKPREEQYYEDTVGQVDVATRFCVVWALTTVIGTLLLWPHGWWLLIPALTYALAYLSYRGAVVAAEEHGAALATLTAFSRFALYERLGLERPTDSAAERRQNRALMELLSGSSEPWVRYPPPRPPVASVDDGGMIS